MDNTNINIAYQRPATDVLQGVACGAGRAGRGGGRAGRSRNIAAGIRGDLRRLGVPRNLLTRRAGRRR